MMCENCDGEGYILNEVRLSEDPASEFACGESVDWSWDEFALCPDCDGHGDEDVLQPYYSTLYIGDNPEGHTINLPVELRDGGVLDFGREHAIVWYSLHGTSWKPTKWEHLLSVLKYYKIRRWLGWGRYWASDDFDEETDI